MLAKEVTQAIKNLEVAEHAVQVQKDWLRRAEKYLRECQKALADATKPPTVTPSDDSAQLPDEALFPVEQPLADTLNHRSGTGRDVTELKEKFVRWLSSNHTGEWLMANQMLEETDAKQVYGKKVYDDLLESMKDICEFEPGHVWKYSRVRLRAVATATTP